MAYSSNNISQKDPAWKNNKLGFSNFRIGTDGCTLTCLTILVNGFGHKETPATLNNKFKALGEGNGYLGGQVVWGGLPSLFPDISLRQITICREDFQHAPLDEIDATLARGQAVLVELDQSPVPGIQNHWVVLYKKEGNDYRMNDPWPNPVDEEPVLLGERYATERPLKKIITAVVWFEKEDAAPPLDDGVYVRVSSSATSGLRLRSQPTTASVTLAMEPAGTYLRVIEDEVDAEAKIGVTDEWLHVRDQRDLEGFVAAWFVDAVTGTTSEPDIHPIDPDPEHELPPGPELDPGPEPQDPKTEPLKVYVLREVGTDGLRMRSQPSMSGALVTILSAATELSILEDADAARTKIGVDGEWVHVKDGEKHEGYVAAWLVTLSLEEDPKLEPDAEDPETPLEPEFEPKTPPTPEPDPETESSPTSMSVIVFPSLGRNGLRMRSEPSLNGSLVSILAGGTKLTVLDDPTFAIRKVGVVNRWLNVQAPDGREGYVAAWYVKLDESAPEIPLAASLIVYVTPLAYGGLRMRSGPSTGFSIVKTLLPNSALTVLGNEEEAIAKIGTSGEWLHVRDESEEEGYVAAWYVFR